MGQTNKNNHFPTITIIMPIRNEANYIRLSLSAVLAQDYPLNRTEIIVADGMSTDGTRGIVQGFQQQNANIKMINNPDRIVPTGLNAAIHLAQGEIIIRVDGHWNIPIDYLSNIIDAFKRNTSIDCLGGKIIRVVKSSTGHAIELARDSLLGGGLSSRNRLEEECVVYQPNIAHTWKSEVFQYVGMFDKRFVKNQDNEFNLRTIYSGYKTLYTPKVFFYYCAPETFQKLFLQLFGYTSFIPMMQLKYRRPLYARYSIPFFALFIWFIFVLFGVVNIIPLVIPIILSCIYIQLNLLGAGFVALKNEMPSKWIHISLSYITIHVATCLGYLCGLFRLLNPPLIISLWQDYYKFPNHKLT